MSQVASGSLDRTQAPQSPCILPFPVCERVASLNKATVPQRGGWEEKGVAKQILVPAMRQDRANCSGSVNTLNICIGFSAKG